MKEIKLKKILQIEENTVMNQIGLIFIWGSGGLKVKEMILCPAGREFKRRQKPLQVKLRILGILPRAINLS